jgi:glycosyltransferase involved in cell wall biosynthesis
MSVRNNEATILVALESLRRQTFTDWELVLVDDGSTDNTRACMQSFRDERVRLVCHAQSAGLAVRLNETIELARGRYFARMDGDDVSYPTRLERQLAFMEQHKDVALTGAHVIVFKEDGILQGKRTPPQRHEEICARPHAGFHIAHPTYFGRIELFRKYRYEPNALLAEDQDMLLRAYRENRFANVGEILLGYREMLNVKKIWKTRRHLLPSLVAQFMREGRPALAARAAVEQVLKAMVDVAAISTGLDYRILAHRAGPATEADRQDWLAVWRSLQDAPRQATGS